MTALGSNKKLTTLHRLLWYSEYGRRDGIHPLERGHVRIKSRRGRRPGLPREGRLSFYPKYGWELAQAGFGTLRTYARLRLMLHKVWTDPERRAYCDAAITPVDDGEALTVFAQTRPEEAYQGAARRGSSSSISTGR
jgi:hypothetical protein